MKINKQRLGLILLAICMATVSSSCRAPIPTRSDVGDPWLEKRPSYWPAAYVYANVRQTDNNLYEVGLADFEEYEAEQERSDFCWAACVQMILSFRGEGVSQKEIVERIKGSVEELEDGTGSPLEIIRSLSGPWSRVYLSNLIGPMINDLTTNWPVLVGMKDPEGGEYGHAFILTEIELSWYGTTPVLQSVELYDPLSGRRISMTGEEFRERLAYAIHAHKLGSPNSLWY